MVVNLDFDTILIWLLVGLVAGFFASHIALGHGLGIVGDVVVGIIGAFLGGFLAGRLPLGHRDRGAPDHQRDDHGVPRRGDPAAHRSHRRHGPSGATAPGLLELSGSSNRLIVRRRPELLSGLVSMFANGTTSKRKPRLQPRQRRQHRCAEQQHHDHVADGPKRVVRKRRQQVEAGEMHQASWPRPCLAPSPASGCPGTRSPSPGCPTARRRPSP